MPPPPDDRPAPARDLIVVALAALAFAPALLGGFVDYDDREMVARNPMLAVGHFADALSVWTGPTLGLYAPLTYSIYAVLAAVSRATAGTLEPAVFHAANLLAHAAGGVAALLLLRRLCGDPRAALIGALLWTVHPVQAEAVSWVASLNTVLCGVLAVAALLLQTLAWDRSRRRTWFAAAGAAFVLALLAKPAAFGVPLATLGINRFVLGRPWRQTLAVFGVAAALATPFVLLGALAQPTPNAFGLTALDRLFVAGHAAVFYLGEVVLPWNHAIDYGLSPDVVLASPRLKWTGLLLVPLAALLAWQALRRGTKRPWLIGAACVFAAGVGPTSGLRDFEFQNVSTVADRYAYVALAGAAIALAMALRGRLRSPTAFGTALALPAGLAVVACAATLKWQSSDTLRASALASNPHSLLALVLEGDRAVDDGDVATVESVCRRFLARRPMFPPINRTLAGVLLRTNRPAEALGPLRRLLAVQPDATAYNDLAVALARTGDTPGARRAIDAAIALRPGDASLRANRDELLRQTK